jgi:hypothetical protein
LSPLKDLSTFEYKSTRGYDRRAQLDFAAFQYLVCTISNFALKKIEVEARFYTDPRNGVVFDPASGAGR